MHTLGNYTWHYEILYDCHFRPQGSTVNMNINQRMYDNAFDCISDKPQRLGVVLMIGESYWTEGWVGVVSRVLLRLVGLNKVWPVLIVH